jgi:hypothetical protein
MDLHYAFASVPTVLSVGNLVHLVGLLVLWGRNGFIQVKPINGNCQYISDLGALFKSFFTSMITHRYVADI